MLWALQITWPVLALICVSPFSVFLGPTVCLPAGTQDCSCLPAVCLLLASPHTSCSLSPPSPSALAQVNSDTGALCLERRAEHWVRGEECAQFAGLRDIRHTGNHCCCCSQRQGVHSACPGPVTLYISWSDLLCVPRTSCCAWHDRQGIC